MNKGFTLIELLAVLILISLLLILGMPAYTSLYSDIKRNTYRSKVSFLTVSAHKYGESIKDEVKDNRCIDTNASELIEKGFITSESKDKDEIIDPTTNKPMNGTLKICYCKDKLDIETYYIIPFVESNVYYVDDVVIYNNKLYKCVIKYKNNGGINSTLRGKRYFEEIGC